MSYSDEVAEKRNGTFSRLSEQPTALVPETRHPGHLVSEERERKEGGVGRELEREKEAEQDRKT